MCLLPLCLLVNFWVRLVAPATGPASCCIDRRHVQAREFLARLQLDVHLQKRKQQLLQQCMRLEASENATYNQALPVVDTACPRTGQVAQVSAAFHDGATSVTQDSPRMDAPVTEDANTATGVRNSETVAATNAIECSNVVSPALDSGSSLQQFQQQLEQLVYQMKVASDAQDMASYMASYSAYCQLAALYSAAAAHPASLTEGNVGVAPAPLPAASTGNVAAQEAGIKHASEGYQPSRPVTADTVGDSFLCKQEAGSV